ncbi:MAG: DUF92 domain-containing protein [Candidatus Helarchaeota archaeon]
MTLNYFLTAPILFWCLAIIGGIVVCLFGIFSIKAGIVDYSGLIAGFVVGISVWIFGGGMWFLVILSFHLVAGAFTKYKYERKRQAGLAQEKGGARGWPNVMANGGTAMMCAIIGGISIYYSQSVSFLPIPNILNSDFPILGLAFFGFLGAISTMTADTLGTEIGLLSKTKPRLITHLSKKVDPGTSGGVTILGELGGVLGSLIVSSIALLVYFVHNTYNMPFIKLPLASLEIIIIGIVAGLAGGAVDSVIGATVQGIFQCQGECGKITEKNKHCGVPAKHLRGWKILENNMVNFLASLAGAMVAIILGYIFLILR